MTGALFLQSGVFGFEEQPGACLTDLIETSEDLGGDQQTRAAGANPERCAFSPRGV
jgi:hypothetical protein